ncbi:hypothetical protein B0T25DRAFT_519063 [Lasiosphaeria hispida]|uniref:Uncharacterized protein n=1 Tax=Lasiosphaeria hispida TaxID=260671 RepID=A0AAJ0HD49_9PEZI|nr:hypothetical protein B0T25DRAFT_519063 [Lasiosphaeria hispida]
MHLKPLTIGLAAITTTLASPTPEPSTTITATAWRTLSIPLPNPYGYASICLLPDDPETALLALASQNPCGAGTAFASTTTINLPLDCLGATHLSTSLRRAHCPLGRTAPPAIVDTVTATPFTRFGWTCGSGLPTVRVEDVTRSLPVPTLGPGQTPPERPTALEVVHHADGRCRVVLGLEQVGGFADRRERASAECAERRATAWMATVTETVRVGCDGCEYVAGGDMAYACPGEGEDGGRVTVGATRTEWVYACEVTPGR